MFFLTTSTLSVIFFQWRYQVLCRWMFDFVWVSWINLHLRNHGIVKLFVKPLVTSSIVLSLNLNPRVSVSRLQCSMYHHGHDQMTFYSRRIRVLRQRSRLVIILFQSKWSRTKEVLSWDFSTRPSLIWWSWHLHKWSLTSRYVGTNNSFRCFLHRVMSAFDDEQTDFATVSVIDPAVVYVFSVLRSFSATFLIPLKSFWTFRRPHQSVRLSWSNFSVSVTNGLFSKYNLSPTSQKINWNTHMLFDSRMI